MGCVQIHWYPQVFFLCLPLKFVLKTLLLFCFLRLINSKHLEHTFKVASVSKVFINVYAIQVLKVSFQEKVNLSCRVVGGCFEDILHKWWPAGVWTSDLYAADTAVWWCYQQEQCCRGQQLGLSIPGIHSWSLDHQSQTKGWGSDQNLSCLAEVSVFLLYHKVILLGCICRLAWCVSVVEVAQV